MSKKKNNNQVQNNDRDELRTSKYPLPFPEVANMDDVGYYPDDVLSDRISRLESERTRLLEMRYDPRHWEVELAYLRREQQIRNVRIERHDAYMRELLLHGKDEEVASRTAFGPITIKNNGSRNLN